MEPVEVAVRRPRQHALHQEPPESILGRGQCPGDVPEGRARRAAEAVRPVPPRTPGSPEGWAGPPECLPGTLRSARSIRCRSSPAAIASQRPRACRPHPRICGNPPIWRRIQMKPAAFQESPQAGIQDSGRKFNALLCIHPTANSNPSASGRRVCRIPGSFVICDFRRGFYTVALGRAAPMARCSCKGGGVPQSAAAR